MVNMPQKKIENHLTDKELKKLIKSKKHDCKMFQKLTLLKMVKKGEKVSKACDYLEISETTGHRWIDNYNENGLAGLEPNYKNNGRPPEISKEQKEELCRILENEDNLTIQRVHQIINDRYNVDYSLRHIKRIMDNLGFNYGKPYQEYSQKPKDAELQLKKT